MIIIATVIAFLFGLFILSKDDFVLLRRNVSQQTIFDAAFFVSLSSLFFSRLFYVVIHPSTAYFNPLVFFIIPYFPGLTFSGLLLGGCLALYMFIMRKRIPLGKLFDIFSLAFFPPCILFLLTRAGGEIYLKHINFSIVFTLSAFFLFILFFLLQKLAARFSWQDGSIALLGLTFTVLTFLVNDFFSVGFLTIPKELSLYVLLLFLLFFSFLVKTFKKTRQ